MEKGERERERRFTIGKMNRSNFSNKANEINYVSFCIHIWAAVKEIVGLCSRKRELERRVKTVRVCACVCVCVCV